MKARSRLAAAGMLELLMDDIVGLDDQSRKYERYCRTERNPQIEYRQKAFGQPCRMLSFYW